MPPDAISPLPVPERITLELTNRCNLSCPCCPRHHMAYPHGEMSPKLFMELVDLFAQAGTKTLVPFFRGEPFMHEQCLELLEYAKRRNLTIQIATNGNLLSKARCIGLVDMKIDFISFSVDATDAGKYATRRVGGSFETLLENLSFLTAYRNKTEAKLPLIQVSAVDTGMREEEYELFVEFWQARADRIRIYPQHSKAGEFGRLAHPHGARRQSCTKPFREMVIYWDGKAALCNHDWNRSSGPCVTPSNALQIWQGTWYAQRRLMQHELKFDHNEPCSSCDHWQQYGEEGKIIGKVHECR